MPRFPDVCLSTFCPQVKTFGTRVSNLHSLCTNISGFAAGFFRFIPFAVCFLLFLQSSLVVVYAQSKRNSQWHGHGSDRRSSLRCKYRCNERGAGLSKVDDNERRRGFHCSIPSSRQLHRKNRTMSPLVDRQFVNNLPLNGRIFQSLIALTSGFVLTKTNSETQGQFSVNGQWPNANYFMIDGVGANIGLSPTTNVDAATADLTPSLSAISDTNNLVPGDTL